MSYSSTITKLEDYSATLSQSSKLFVFYNIADHLDNPIVDQNQNGIISNVVEEEQIIFSATIEHVSF